MLDLKKIKSKWKAEYEQKIDATSNQLWELISSPSNLELFHPFCKSNKAIVWPGEKSIDELIYLNDLTYIRKFHNWEKSKGYSLFIGESEFNWPLGLISNKLFAFSEKNRKKYIMSIC